MCVVGMELIRAFRVALRSPDGDSLEITALKCVQVLLSPSHPKAPSQHCWLVNQGLHHALSREKMGRGGPKR